MWVEILIGAALLCLYIYHYVTKNFGEFKKRGIPYAEPSFPWGSSNAKATLNGEYNFIDADRLLGEKEFKDEKIWGWFLTGQPQLVINDEELAKHILIKDFDYFTDLRGFGYESESKDGQLIKYMFTNMKGEKWKKVRSMMSGVFTSGKLKMMSHFIVQSADNMEDYVASLEQKGQEFEVRDLVTKFNLDAFASAGFGFEQNSFKEPDNVFFKMAMTMIGAPGYSSGWDMVRMIFIMTFPGFSKLVGIPNFPMKPLLFFSDIVERTYEQRINSGVKRNDIIDVCIEEMNKSEHLEEFKEDKKKILIANALMLFLAGFDNLGLGLSQVLHNLVKNEDVQEKFIQEIDEALENSGGEITYDLVEGLQYVDWVIRETFRYKMLFTAHERRCTRDYKIPDTDIVIPKGRIVHVYFNHFVNSRKNFINPDNFDPENFNPDNKPNKFAFMMFGQGPRACPGTRYAFLSMKIFLIKFFQKYKVTPGEKTNMGIAELDPHQFAAIKGGVWLKVAKRCTEDA